MWQLIINLNIIYQEKNIMTWGLSILLHGNIEFPMSILALPKYVLYL